jgi:hypothetical protein
MSRKQRATLISDLDQLVRPVPELAVVALAGAGHMLDSELKRQKAVGLVEQYGQVVIDERLLVPDILFAVPRTEGLQRAIEAGWIIDQGVSIPPGWVSTKDGRIVRPGG